MIVSMIILFALFSAGGVFATAFTNKKYGEVLPLTCAGIVGILFLSGLLGILRYGVYMVMLAALFAYVASFICVSKRNAWHSWIAKMFTPATALFAAAMVLFAFFDRNKLASDWDEFSHWVDSVKAMILLDDFITNPASNSAFRTYPPAMALFQYTVQRLTLWISSKDVVMFENMIFWSWKIFAFSWFFPFLERYSWKNAIPFLAVSGAVFLTPSIFYGNIFSTAYIDAFLGMVCAGGFASVLLTKEKDWCYSALVFSACAVLVLSKDSGILFAAFLAAAYVAERMTNCSDRHQRIAHFLGAVMAVVLPKILWKMEIAASGASSMFPDSVNMVSLIQSLTSGEDTYYWDVIHNYFAAFCTRGIEISAASFNIPHINIPYIILFTIGAATILVFFVLLRKQDPCRRISAAATGIMLLMAVVYSVGLCATYLTNFSQREALQLASFERYLNTAFLALWIITLLMMAEFFRCIKKNQLLLSAIGFILMVLILPMGLIFNYITGYDAAYSQKFRGKLEPIAQEIHKYTDEDDTVWFISQEDVGYDFWATRFNARPAKVNNFGTFSIGQPFYEGDHNTRSITVQEWMQMLKNDYDYVALYHLNDYFYEHYHEAFEDANAISENTVYLVDKSTGLLKRCEE